MALNTNGTVVNWGMTGAAVPAGLANVVAIGAGADPNGLALLNNGTVVAWGGGDYGVSSPPPGLTNVIAIAAGYVHSLALKSDGTVVAWGDNSSGQTNVPAGLSNVVAISAGEFHSLALKSDGTVVGWGDNTFGESVAPAGLSNVVAIVAGINYFSLALKRDGTVQGWGFNVIGDTTPPSGLSNVVAIAAGNEYGLALKDDGTAGLNNVMALAAFVDLSMAIVGDGSPHIVRQPFNQTSSNSVPVSFSIGATGQSALNYQWQFNGKNLTDNAQTTGSHSNVLTLTAVTASNAGSYQVIVTNTYGSATAAATLAVLGPPLIQATTSSSNSFPFTWNTVSGQSYQIQATAGLNPANWTNLGSSITATNSTTTVAEPLSASSQHFYRVVLLP